MGPLAGRMVGEVERRRVLEVLHIVEGEAGRMAVVVEVLHTVVEGIGLVEGRRMEVAEGEGILAVVDMGCVKAVLHKAAAEAAGSPDCTGLVTADILLAVHTLEVELESHRSSAEVDSLVAGTLEEGIVQGAAAAGILLLQCKRSINWEDEAGLTRWRSTILRWVATLIRWIRHYRLEVRGFG